MTEPAVKVCPSCGKDLGPMTRKHCQNRACQWRKHLCTTLHCCVVDARGHSYVRDRGKDEH